MLVKNLQTGLIWDVDGDLLERLKKSDDFELVKEQPKPKKKSPVKKDE